MAASQARSMHAGYAIRRPVYCPGISPDRFMIHLIPFASKTKHILARGVGVRRVILKNVLGTGQLGGQYNAKPARTSPRQRADRKPRQRAATKYLERNKSQDGPSQTSRRRASVRLHLCALLSAGHACLFFLSVGHSVGGGAPSDVTAKTDTGGHYTRLTYLLFSAERPVVPVVPSVRVAGNCYAEEITY